MPGRAKAWLAAAAMLCAGVAASAVGQGPVRPTVVVLGLESAIEGAQWLDLRLGMGLRGRLGQMLADSGAFEMLEERDLVPSVREALGGHWLRERAAGPGDLDRLQEASGADWVAHGRLESVGVTRDRVSGPVGGRRWAYRATVRLCLHAIDHGSLCREGSGRSVTRVIGAVVQYRGDEVVFDQAGPAQAVDRALVAAFDRLMPEWEAGQ